MRFYSYEEFLRDLAILERKIDFPFDTIVAVARGGLTLAHFLAESKGVRRVFTAGSIGYDGTRRLGEPECFAIPDLQGSRHVLIVDDIVDTGATLKQIRSILQERHPHCSFRSATLFYKKGASVVPDFFVQYATQWIDFFWTREIDGPHD